MAVHQLQGFKGDMATVASKVGTEIEEEMGIGFGVMYDGWTHGTMHYVGVYGVYEIDGSLRLPLLALSPLDQGSQDADAHMELFRNVLAVYNKTPDMVQFLVSDNCNTNRSIATKLGVPLVGCASHRFNLAVNKFLTKHETLLNQVNNLMKQLRLPNNAAELNKRTHLRPKKRDVACWSSTYEMLDRYVKLRAKIHLVEAVKGNVPSSSEHKRLACLLDHLKKFDSVCERLQRESTSLSEVRLLSDSILVDYPIMGSYLKSSSKIVHSPAFETGSVKVCSGSKLTTAETAALRHLERPQTPRTTASKRMEREMDYAAQLIEKRG